MRLDLYLWILLLVSASSYAAEYACKVESKFNSEHQYTSQEIEKYKFSTRLEDLGSKAFISRCSFVQIAAKVMCDRYEVDKVEFDQTARIKKFYVFSGQFDFQLFHNLLFVENNGRGTIAYGKCEMVFP